MIIYNKMIQPIYLVALIIILLLIYIWYCPNKNSAESMTMNPTIRDLGISDNYSGTETRIKDQILSDVLYNQLNERGESISTIEDLDAELGSLDKLYSTHPDLIEPYRSHEQGERSDPQSDMHNALSNKYYRITMPIQSVGDKYSGAPSDAYRRPDESYLQNDLTKGNIKQQEMKYPIGVEGFSVTNRPKASEDYLLSHASGLMSNTLDEILYDTEVSEDNVFNML